MRSVGVGRVGNVCVVFGGGGRVWWMRIYTMYACGVRLDRF
jgi:Na+/alanine symporter